MNKYEKAWSDCFEMVEVSVEPSHMQKFENGADTLRQLVDRATPAIPLRGISPKTYKPESLREQNEQF